MSIFHFFFLIFVANGKEPRMDAGGQYNLGNMQTFFPIYAPIFFSAKIIPEICRLFSAFLPDNIFPVFSSIFHHFSSFFHQKSIIFHAFLRRKRAAEVTCRRPTTTLPDPVSDPQSWMDVRQDSCRLRLSRLCGLGANLKSLLMLS